MPQRCMARAAFRVYLAVKTGVELVIYKKLRRARVWSRGRVHERPLGIGCLDRIVEDGSVPLGVLARRASDTELQHDAMPANNGGGMQPEELAKPLSRASRPTCTTKFGTTRKKAAPS